MLTLEDQGRPNIEEVAENVLGREIWVAWPHMVEAKVVAVKVLFIFRLNTSLIFDLHWLLRFLNCCYNLFKDAKRTFSLAYGDKHEVIVQENEGKSKDEFFVSARGIADR